MNVSVHMLHIFYPAVRIVLVRIARKCSSVNAQAKWHTQVLSAIKVEIKCGLICSYFYIFLVRVQLS